MLNSKEFVRELQLRHESAWMNPNVGSAETALAALPLTRTDVDDAEARLERFAPFIKKVFPETAADRGLIESPLTEIEHMRAWLNENEGAQLAGKLFLKRDSDLPVAGSVKARGGCYAVLKHTEDLALANRLVEMRDDYSVFATRAFRDFFSQYELHVGSTGNLGLSIGIMGAALGYRVTVHMSADARQWKKDLLRAKGVTVLEYGADYSCAVQKGRERAAEDPRSYFIDDENSVDLFLGYAVAARRLKAQLAEQNIAVDEEHPLLVYIPCGVGGAPGGICFGLKQEFGDAAHVYFAEPVEAPCMLLGLASGLQNAICVQDIGLTGRTAADGLAVSRPSGFVGETVKEMVGGGFTVSDEHLFTDLHALHETETFCRAVRLRGLCRCGGAVQDDGLSRKQRPWRALGECRAHRLGDGRRARAGRRTRKVPRKLKRDKKKDFTQCVKSFFFAPRRGGEPRYAGVIVRV